MDEISDHHTGSLWCCAGSALRHKGFSLPCAGFCGCGVQVIELMGFSRFPNKCVSKKNPKPEFLWSFLSSKDKNPKTRSLGLYILEESPTGQLRSSCNTHLPGPPWAPSPAQRAHLPAFVCFAFFKKKHKCFILYWGVTD